MNPADLVKIREREQRAACEVLGVKEVVFLGYPDQGLEDTSEFRKEAVRLIRKYRPETIATTDPYRKYLWHRDHRITGRVVLDAIFPFARDYWAYPDLIEQGYMPHKVKEVLLWGTEDPNYCVDITDVFDTKLAALRKHESQVGSQPFEEMKERVAERGRLHAEGQKFDVGEAFHRLEILR